MKSNCFIYVVRKWLQCNGYIIMRWSNYGWWPHFLWSSNLLQFEEFQPVESKRVRWFPPFLFKGYIKHSDIRDGQGYL